MALQTPPPEIPIVSFLTPNKADQGLLEFWNTEIASYVPLDIGAPHPNTRKYPGFRLGKQTPLQGDQKWILRTWVTDETSPDWFNYALKYSAEDNAYPIFIRTYRERRDAYTPRTKGEPLGTLYKLVLDDDKKGSGYPFGVLPKLVFDDPDAEPTDVALGHGVVSPDGTIQECVIDFGGTGYTADVRFRVEVVGDSNPAEGTAYVQKQTAILTQEQAQLYPEDSPFFAQYLQVARIYEVLPGPFLVSQKLDIDGKVLGVSTRRNICANIVTGEDLDAGIWAKVERQHTDDDFVCEEVLTSRQIPGNPMTDTKIDDDGKVITTTKTMVEKSTIVSSEVISTGNWIKTFQEDIDDTDKIAWEVVVSRPVPGNAMPQTQFNGEYEKLVSNTILKQSSTITPSVGESGGVVTTVEGERVSDIVSRENTTLRTWLDKKKFSVSIPESIIPLEFRAGIPFVTESHTVAGQASMPTLLPGEFERSEEQVDKVLKQVTVRSIGDVALPITQIGTETSTEYGGAVLEIRRTLDDSLLTADQGEDIVGSLVNPIGDNLMWFKETKKRPSTDAAWPTLPGSEFDKEMQVFTEEETQVVDASDTPSSGTYFVESIKPLDKWRARRSKITREPTAVDLASALVEEVDGPFQFPGLVFLAPGGGGYYRRQASAQLCQQILRTWWMTSPTKPTTSLPGDGGDVEVQYIIMDDIVISTLNDVSVLAYSGMALHDAITTFGVFVYPATVPSYTDYVAMIGTEIVVGASIEPTDIPDLWKIQTKSVIAR